MLVERGSQGSNSHQLVMCLSARFVGRIAAPVGEAVAACGASADANAIDRSGLVSTVRSSSLREISTTYSLLDLEFRHAKTSASDKRYDIQRMFWKSSLRIIV